MEKIITIFCIVFIIIAILTETEAFFRNFLNLPKNKITQESNKIVISENNIIKEESEKATKKINSKDQVLIPSFMYYEEPVGCPGFGC